MLCSGLAASLSARQCQEQHRTAHMKHRMALRGQPCALATRSVASSSCAATCARPRQSISSQVCMNVPPHRRFVDATKQRARAESLLRYNLYVDSMPIDDLPALNSDQVSPVGRTALRLESNAPQSAAPPLSIPQAQQLAGRPSGKRLFVACQRRTHQPATTGMLCTPGHEACVPTMLAPCCPQVNRILAQTLNTKRLKDRLMETSQLIAEVNTDFGRAMNKVGQQGRARARV
jgi:hypothetical protein